MARVLVVLKVYPSDVDEGLRRRILDELRVKLPSDFDLVRATEEPVAFGYSVLRIYVTIPEDIEGGTQALEDAVASVSGVDEVEVEMVHRLSEF
ncbi:MAG: elongation factor 1-beta [Fervidicoccaceae archaeon]